MASHLSTPGWKGGRKRNGKYQEPTDKRTNRIAKTVKAAILSTACFKGVLLGTEGKRSKDRYGLRGGKK